MASGRLGKGGKGRPRRSTPSAALFAGATYTVTNTGWLVAAHAFPEGQVPSGQGVVFQGISTQNHVLRTWPDNSAKHVLLVANMASTGSKTLELGTATTGSFVATAPTLTVEATPEGLPTRTATFTDTTYANARFSGPLAKETRQCVTFTSATGSLAQVRVWFYLMSFNDGTHRCCYVLDNSIDHADSAAIPASVVFKANGSAVLTKTCTVTAGPGTLSHGGGNHINMSTSAHGLSKWDYIRALDADGDPSYLKIWNHYDADTVTGYNGFNPNVGLSGTSWSKVTFLLPWGARGVHRQNIGGHDQAQWNPDLETFFQAQLLYRVDPSFSDKTWSTTMTIANNDLFNKTMEAGDFNLYNYGIYAPNITNGGQRPELGILPEWVMQWTKAPSIALYDWMTILADRAAETSFHITKASDNSALKLSDDPDFYYGNGVQGSLAGNKSWKGIIINPEAGSGKGPSHQGGYFFVPYLVTGDWFYQDELIHHAAFGVRSSGNDGVGARNDGEGILFGMINGLRSCAWAATKLAECVSILPSSESAWLTEFQAIIDRNNTYEDYLVGIEPDSTLGSTIAWNVRLRYGNTTELVSPAARTNLSHDGTVSGSYPDQMFQNAYLAIAADYCRRLGVGLLADYRVRIPAFWAGMINNTDIPKKMINGFQYYPMPWMTDGGPLLNHASFQACLDYNELKNPGGNWSSTPLFAGGADYSMYLRAILAIGSRDGVTGATTALNTLEAMTDANGNYTTQFQYTGDGFSLGLGNFAFAFSSSEGYRA